ALLGRLGVTHILLDRALFPPEVSPFPSAFTRDRLRDSPGLALEAAADPLWLYRLTGRAPATTPPSTSPVGVFFEAEALPPTGVAEADAAPPGGRRVAAHPRVAPAGCLTFGPYRVLPAGAWRVRFRVRGGGLAVDVAADEGRRVVGERTLPSLAAWEDVELDIRLERATPL